MKNSKNRKNAEKRQISSPCRFFSDILGSHVTYMRCVRPRQNFQKIKNCQESIKNHPKIHINPLEVPKHVAQNMSTPVPKIHILLGGDPTDTHIYIRASDQDEFPPWPGKKQSK